MRQLTTGNDFQPPICYESRLVIPSYASSSVVPDIFAVTILNPFRHRVCFGPCLACMMLVAGGSSLVGQPPSSTGAITQSVAAAAADWVPSDELVALGRNDASLKDVAIVSEDRLVAVGDRGALLVTDNGGRSWQLGSTPTTANLHSVSFSPLGFGVVVGGWIGSDTRSSHSVVLRTVDGGKTWSVIPTPDMPRLIGLHVHEDRCLAWGDYSPAWQTSLFQSFDGGMTWQGVTACLGHSTAAGLSATGEVIAVDQMGRAFAGNLLAPESLSNQRPPATVHVAHPDQRMSCVHHTGDRWLACGAGGELIESPDGRHWVNVPLPLSDGARELCWWQAIEQVGEHLWICGRPGSIVLHSNDRGRSWQILRTGQALPLTAIQFVDHNRGWATGPLGLILATRDGGRSWYAQRQRARRLGLLAVGVACSDLPWSPLVAAAWDEQVAVAASLYQELQPIEQAGFLPSPDIARTEVAGQLGLAACELNFTPASSANRFIDNAALDLLSWRPDVLLISQSAAPAAEGPIQPPLDMPASALKILKFCAAPNAQWVAELGLVPWNVNKLVGICSSEAGQFTEQSARVLRQPHIAIWDALLPLSAKERQAAESVAMRTLWTQSQSKSAFTSLMGAIAPSPETERQVAIRNVGNQQLLMGRVHRVQSVQQLAQVPSVDRPLDQWMSDLDFVLRAVPASETVPLLQLLADRLQLNAQWPKRRVVYQRLIEVCPQSDAADWGRLRLLSLENSDERRAWERSSVRGAETALQPAGEAGQMAPLRLDGATAAARLEPWSASPFGPMVRERHDAPRASMVVPASAEVQLDHPLSATPATWQPLLHQTSLAPVGWLARPDAQLMRNRDRNRGGGNLSATEEPELAQLRALQNASQLIGWPQMAAQERALASGEVSALRWVVSATAATQPPTLDGRLDDVCWNRATPMHLTGLEELRSSLTPPPDTTIRWSYDQNYLYLAVVGLHQRNSPAPAVVQRRTYDADLAGVDHVQVVLDTDRDYSTAIELAVSADGRTYDRCCGMAAYNPKWHVSVVSNAEYWIAEAAIELKELTMYPDLSGQAWAISARRMHPTGIAQSWSQLRSHEPYLHASGLLLFKR